MSIGRHRRVGNSEPRAVGPDLKQRTGDPGILSRIARVWTEITVPAQEAPKGRAISVVSMEVLEGDIHREFRRKPDPETIHAHPLEVRVIKACAVPSAGHPQGAGSKGEDPGVEVMEDLPEVVSAAVDLPVDWVEASDISRI
jgi:hypothetical protein